MTTNDLRIVFMGTPDFAVPTLDTLIKRKEHIVGVVTQPDRPKGRGRKLTAPPVKILAENNDIPVMQPTKIRGDEFLVKMKKLSPDLIIVVAYGRILPGHIINLPSQGTINVHASLLPKYRGAAPIQWAIINGETETGVTIMQMDEGLDTGDILLVEKIDVERQDTSATMAVKISELGASTMAKALDLMKGNKLFPTPQDDSHATLAPPLTKELGLVDWSKSASEISCLIRGLDPWPCTYTLLNDKRLRIFNPTVVDNPDLGMQTSAQAVAGSLEPGTVHSANANGLLVTTGEGYLRVREIQPENSRRMTVDAYLRGHQLERGTKLG